MGRGNWGYNLEIKWYYKHKTKLPRPPIKRSGGCMLFIPSGRNYTEWLRKTNLFQIYGCLLFEMCGGNSIPWAFTRLSFTSARLESDAPFAVDSIHKVSWEQELFDPTHSKYCCCYLLSVKIKLKAFFLSPNRNDSMQWTYFSFWVLPSSYKCLQVDNYNKAWLALTWKR